MALAAVQKLYLSEDQSDVAFYIGPDKCSRVRFPAHKLVLRSASPVFSAMFSEKFRENESGEVFITDIALDVFQNILKFAYFGKFKASTVVNYIDTLHAADKYLMIDLSRFCLSQLETFHVCFHNFWNFFNFVRRFYSESMSPKLVTNTLKFLDENADKILECEEFQSLDSDAVCTIIKRSSLQCASEIQILHQVAQWAKSECCRQNLEINAENEKKIMKDVKFHIRYSLIPRETLLNDFKTNVNFLTPDEKNNILKASVERNYCLPPPWNSNLLKLSRAIDYTPNLLIDYDELVGSAETDACIPKCCLLLVAAEDCVLKPIEINTHEEVTHVYVEVTDLNGNIYDTWTEKNSNPKESSFRFTKSICLKKFKPYKFNLFCKTGYFFAKYKSTSLFKDDSGDLIFYFGNFPNNTSLDLNSSEFWEKIFRRECKIPESIDMRNSIMEDFSIKI